MIIYLVTEGNKNIGFGHIARNVSLFDAFSEIGITPKFIINCDQTIEIIMKNYTVIKYDWISNDRELFLKEISGSDIVIVDSYLATLELYNNITQRTKVPVFIDDICRLEYPNGIIINSAIYANSIQYKPSNEYPRFLGSFYTMLRKEFWDLPIDKPINEKIQNILITFGGQDLHNLSYPILEFLKMHFPTIKKRIIVNENSIDFNKINNLKEINIEIFEKCNANQMKYLMIEADLCICAGGQTLYELCAIGTPAIIISLAENQQINCETFGKLGISSFIGIWNSENLYVRLYEEINSLMKKDKRKLMIDLGKKHIKPDGSRLIVSKLLEFLKGW